ncbi:DUF6785 family protein [Candidatus Poribacteria bacterium]
MYDAERGPILQGVTFRAIFTGLICTAFLAIATPVSDLLVQGTWIAACHLPIGVIFVFVLLVIGINVPLKKLGISFSNSELIVIYCIMLIPAGIPSLGLSAYVVPILASPPYYATVENEWETLFFQYIPDWIAPSGDKAMRYFYEGLPGGMGIPWAVWVKPLVLWSIFAMAMYLVMICLCVILRKQWMDRERLIFPLVQLPLEVLKEDRQPALVTPFFKNRLMWAGFAIPAIIHGINGLHFHIPSVPQLKLFFDLGVYFTSKPWNIVRPLWAIIHFSVIGFVYLLPVQLSFSLWFFYFFFHAQSIIGRAMGKPVTNATGYATKGFAAYQMAGAIIALVLFAAWRMRSHLADIFRKAFNRGSEVDDSGEVISYRFALLGLFVGTIIMCLWSMAAGASLAVILPALIIFYITMIAMTRMISEGGMLFIQTPFRPLDLIIPVTGSTILGSSNLTILAYQEMVFMFDIRSSLMPSVMDSLKLSEGSVVLGKTQDTKLEHKARRARLGIAIFLSIIVTMAISYITVLIIGYRYGGANLSQWFFVGGPQVPFRRLSDMLFHPRSPSGVWLGFMGIGAVFMIFLTIMRAQFFWWPFHPIGYAMGCSWPMIQLWCSILLGWFFKSIILRYGGLRAYVKFRTFFLGMVMGEFLSGGVWLIVDFIAGKSGHRIFLF